MIKINKDAKFSKSNGYLFIGRQEKRKNFNFFNMLSKENDFRENNFIAITNKIISTDNIEFLIKPTESEKYEIFQRTNIYLALNTKRESFGITLLEAVNNGNLAITSDLPAFKNVLINSHVVFENKSYRSLISLLSSISGSNIEKLWDNQFSDLNNYDLDKNMEKFIYIYSKL
jgi:glycosyltransferase involved in cell wall biosynthesis